MQAAMLAWVVTYLVHSTLLVLGAWLLEQRWSDRPERMSAVWKTALVGGLFTATLQTGLGIAPVAGRWDLAPELSSREPEAPEAGLPARASWPPPTAALAGGELAEAERAIAPVPAIAAARVAWSERELVVAEAEREREPMLAAAPVSAEPPSASPSSSAEASTPSPWAAVVPWVMGLVALGALLGLASVAVAFVALRQQLEGRRPLAEGTLPTLLEGLRRRAGIDRAVTLTVAPRVQVPMAVGVLRPEIVVPTKAAQGLPPAHQESLLAHELAHVLRRDPAWRLVALLVERVFFFQPLNRLASRRVAQSAEYLCDDWAARHTRQPLALASCLTEIATWVARTGPVAATMAGPRSILGRRVQRLLQPARTNTRPWWLSAALGLPLLGVVAVAPGVGPGAQAKGERHRKAAERVVVIDEDGRRHELRPDESGAIVVQGQDGELVVRRLGEPGAAPVVAGDEASPRGGRKATRQQEQARNEARREARKELRRAFRAAKARGDAAPSRGEIDAILRQAGVAEASRSEHVELHVVVPGELELHGRVPIDVESLEDGIEEGVEGALEDALEGLEGVEGLEELGPMLEEIQQALEAEGLDVVMLRRPGAHDPELHIVLSPEQRRALHDAERMHHLAARERAHAEHHGAHEGEARREAVRTRQEALRRHAQAERDAMREVERTHRDGARRRSQAEHDALRMEREELRRQIERAHRDRLRRESQPELPTVWMPAPEAPAAWSFPVPAPAPEPPAAAPMPPGMGEMPAPPRARRLRVPAPPAPRAPIAPAAPAAPTAPVAPTVPSPDVGPVVWVSWPPPTTAGRVALG